MKSTKKPTAEEGEEDEEKLTIGKIEKSVVLDIRPFYIQYSDGYPVSIAGYQTEYPAGRITG